MKRLSPIKVHRISKRGKIVKNSLEVYTRTILPCFVKSCKKCNQIGIDCKINPDLKHILFIGSPKILALHLDILEKLSNFNIIITKSVLSELKSSEYKNYEYKKVINFLEKTDSPVVFFENNLLQTKTPLENPTGFKQGLFIADWYKKHTQEITNFKISYLTILKSLEDGDLEYMQKMKQTSQVVTKDFDDFLRKEVQEKGLVDLFETRDSDVSGEVEKQGEFVYDKLLERSEIEAMQQNGEVLIGNIFFDYKKRDEAYVKCQSSSSVMEVNIFGKKNLNRVFQNSLVAVKILPKSEWRHRYSDLKAHEETNEEENVEEIKINKEEFQTKEVMSGKVVGIVKPNLRPLVVTMMKREDTDYKKGGRQTVICVPFDRAYPKIRVNSKQIYKYENQRLVVNIKQWEKRSMYPEGHFVEALGPIGDPETASKVILRENNLVCLPFGEKLVNCLPPDWQIPENEIKNRLDIRSNRTVLSIDPLGCTDIDDGLSVHELGGEKYEIGVHIADVTHFLKLNNELDKEARSRGTTVYLSREKINMIPERLSNMECSLMSGKDRLAVSVFWKIDLSNNTFVKQSTEFKRTVLKSSLSLNYDEANYLLTCKNKQKFNDLMEKDLEKNKKDSDADDIKSREKIRNLEMMKNKTYTDIRNRLLVLEKMGTALRKKRMKDGAMDLNPSSRLFEKSDDKKRQSYLNAHFIIEEMMVYANASVAEKIKADLCNVALLRNHNFSPSKQQISNINKKFESFGVEKLSFSDNVSFTRSLKKIRAKNEKINSIMNSLIVMTLSEARYICAGSGKKEDESHVGLALQNYTHFTSPIRRYADVIVHRQLLKCAGLEPDLKVSAQEDVIKTCTHLNSKNRSSRFAQKMSKLFEKGLLLRTCNVYLQGVITEIKDNGFAIHLPNFIVDSGEDFEVSDNQFLNEHLLLKDKNGNFNMPNRGKDLRESNIHKCTLTREGNSAIKIEVPGLDLNKQFSILEKIPVQVSIPRQPNIYRFPSVILRYAYELDINDIPKNGIREYITVNT